MAGAPNSYADPYWTDLAGSTEQKLGLPSGLLVGVLTKGERSNADQVSEAGAKTPFQIIPATRAAAIKKWGIDPYLSPENAAEVAGNLLKDSLDRNKGNPVLAVSEYHGGTNRDNWGPRTKAYTKRVVGMSPDHPEAANAAPAPASQGGSTFDRVSQQMGFNAVPESSVANIFKAYQGGQMSTEESKAFEDDVGAGRIMLPRGAALTTAAAPDAASNAAPATGQALPAGVVEAYTSGRMTPDERAQLEQDVKAGHVSMPAGVQLAAPQQEVAPSGIGRQLALTARHGIEGIAAGAGAFVDPVIMAIGGGVRAATGSDYTPATVAGLGHSLANTMGLPEPIGERERMVGALTRGVAGGAAGAGVANLAAGMTGGTTQAVMQTLATQPALQAVAGGAASTASQAVVEAGGSPLAQLSASLVAGVAAPMAAGAAARAARMVRPGEPAPPQPASQPVSAEELSATARQAAEGGIGSKQATKDLAGQTSPDPKIVEGAKRLGIEDHLQPDHVTTNQAYREMAQAVKSVPGAEGRAAELQGLEAVARRASALIDEYGGSRDLSTLDQAIKGRMQKSVDELSGHADTAYADLRAAIPARDASAAPNVLKFIEERTADLGGKENLTSMEKMIARKLTPKPILNDAGAVVGEKAPTYALLDDVRRDLTAARVQRAGPFKDADTGLIKVLEKHLKTDQRAAVEPYGQLDKFEAAQGLVRVRKGIEDDMGSLFGQALDGSMVGELKGAVAALPKGDTSRLIGLLKAIPESMRQEVVASGLSTAFNVSAKNQNLSFTNFTHFYEGLLRNKQAAAAVMTNLPPQARKQLSDLYRVAKGISSATRERITTGRIMAVTQQIKGADTLMANIYGVAKRSAAGLAVEAVTTPLGLPGAGISAGIASALTRGKPDTMKAADKLISSPEFAEAVRQATAAGPQRAARQFAATRAFREFLHALKSPRDIGSPEQWILNALTQQQIEHALNNRPAPPSPPARPPGATVH